MNEKNFEYLKDNLKYMGFGENLNQALKAAVTEGKKDFTLDFQTEIGRQPFSAVLHFRKSDNADMYFFNKWEGELKNEVGKMQQTFYLNRGQGVTLKEGFNLLEGRAVHKELANKEGQKYSAWLQLDGREIDRDGNNKLRHYHQNYGYNLEETLARFPIRELKESEGKERLLYSLQKGNVQAVTFEKNGFAEKLYIEAAPQFKSLNVYDHTGTKIPLHELEKRFDISVKKKGPEVTVMDRVKINGKEVEGTGGQTYDPRNSVKQENAKGVEQEMTPQKTALLPKKDQSKGLVEKKKESKGKGLHI